MARGGRRPFQARQSLAQIDSAKSVFDFDAPCAGRVIHLHAAARARPRRSAEPVLEIETSDPAMHDWIPPAAGRDEAGRLPDGCLAAPRAGLAARTW